MKRKKKEEIFSLQIGVHFNIKYTEQQVVKIQTAIILILPFGNIKFLFEH
jgi:hypothetical protein